MNTNLQHTKTYHLDQNVRGFVSTKNERVEKIGKLIRERVSARYFPEKHEAVLPFALLEYAGVRQKSILQQIEIPKSVVCQRSIRGIKDFLESTFKEKLPECKIHEKLQNKLKHSNDYAKPFLRESIALLPKIYPVIIAQLSWDRCSQMEWSKDKPDEERLKIRKMIVRSIVQEPDLYILRHCCHLLPLLTKRDPNAIEGVEHFLQIMEKMKVKPDEDIGDCELIHTAINGQPSEKSQKSRVVDCYTMDDLKDIKRRFIVCLFFYELLNYRLNSQYFGKVYIIDKQTGEEIDEIDVRDYLPSKVLQRIIINRDIDTLFLLNK
ncbi:MAG: hypothetical protein OXK80_04200 [Bdellovibrionales bacterium]|nr:hypothetical protein [Bdellovibrionales bacterium]